MTSSEMSILFSGFQQRIILNGEPFYPYISSTAESVPSNCNAVCIRLDASSTSLLNWKKEIARAEALQEAGIRILWEMDFSLYTETFSDEARFLSLEMAVKHFTKTIWPLFSQASLGVILYRGSLDFSEGFPWSFEEQEACEGSPAFFCREVILKHLKLLASYLPEEAACFLLLDADSMHDAAAYFRLTDQAAFFPFHLILKGRWPKKYPYALPSLAWDHDRSPLGMFSPFPGQALPELRVPLAVFLPEETDWDAFAAVIEQLGSTPFRMIPEKLLTHEWEGVDRLFVCSKGVTLRGKRKLCGFAAAGGLVITIGEALNIPNETVYPIKTLGGEEGSLLLEISPLFSPAVSLQSDQ